MAAPVNAPLLQAAMLLAGACFAGAGGTATSVGLASARVLPSTLSASVALYTRTDAGHLCSADCASLARPAPVRVGDDGVAQFTLFGETASNYIVRLGDTRSGARPGATGEPIELEPTLTADGRVLIAVAPAQPNAAIQVVINYN